MNKEKMQRLCAAFLAWLRRTGKAFGALLRRNWPDVLKPVTVLGCICLVVSALLAVTNYFTAPVIAEAERDRANASRYELLPAEDFLPVEGSWPGVREAYAAMEGDAVIGYVITGVGVGYGGEVPVITALDTGGTVLGIQISGTEETQGQGSRIEEPAFKEQFGGLPARPLVLNEDIQQVAGATVSSRAATEAVNSAIAAWREITGKEA